MNDSSIEIDVVFWEQVFHVVTPGANLKALLFQLSVGVVFAQVVHVRVQSSFFAFVPGVFQQLLFVLLPKQRSHFLNFDPVHIRNDLLLHPGVLSDILEFKIIMTEVRGPLGAKHLLFVKDFSELNLVYFYEVCELVNEEVEVF